MAFKWGSGRGSSGGSELSILAVGFVCELWKVCPLTAYCVISFVFAFNLCLVFLEVSRGGIV
eukprot:7837535-Pyramimonas_sp.AAC.1